MLLPLLLLPLPLLPLPLLLLLLLLRVAKGYKWTSNELVAVGPVVERESFVSA